MTTYDAWKTREPDWDQPEPFCRECDDAGCLACCEAQLVTLEDLDELPPAAREGGR